MTKSVKKPYTITDSGMTRAELFEEDIIMKNNSSIKTVVAVGIGAALFFVLGRFVAIPSPVPNTNISLQYAVLGLLAAMYGPVAGGLIGFIGHTLIDLSWGGSPWWSWVITSAFVGVVIGLFAKKLNVQDGEFGKGKVVVFVVSNVIAHVIGWVVVAPVLDILIYAEPAKDGKPEKDCTNFLSDDVVCEYKEDSFLVGNVDKYTIVIWMEGDDSECVDSIIGGSVEMSMHIDTDFDDDTSLLSKFIQDIKDTLNGDKPINAAGNEAPNDSYYTDKEVTWKTRRNQ